MQKQFVITIDDKVSVDFVLDFLKNINFIKSIRPHKKNGTKDSQTDEITLLSEKTLMEDWLSEEDTRWDQVL